MSLSSIKVPNFLKTKIEISNLLRSPWFWGIFYVLTIFIWAKLYMNGYKKDPYAFIAHKELNAQPEKLIDKISKELKNGKDIVEQEREKEKKSNNLETIVSNQGVTSEESNKSAYAGLEKAINKQKEFIKLRIKIEENKKKVEERKADLGQKQILAEGKAKENYLTKKRDELRNNKDISEESKEGEYRKLDRFDDNIRPDFQSNKKEYIPKGIATEIENLENNIRELKSNIETDRDSIISLYNEVNKIVGNSSGETDYLRYIDFFNYSAGIATTTTFGEILAIDEKYRLFVSIQLLSSVLILSKFIDSLKSDNKIRPENAGVKEAQQDNMGDGEDSSVDI